MNTNKIINVVQLTILVLLLIFVSYSAAWANIYYVSKSHPNASNSNPGTLNLPWLTIQHAINMLRAGDTVYIRQGTYYESLSMVTYSGTLYKPITFQNYPGEIVKIESITSSGGDPALKINVSYINFKGFKVHKATASSIPVYIPAGKNIVLDSLEIWGPGSWDGIKISNTEGETSYITVKNCDVHTANHEGIYISSVNNNPIHHIYLENNIIHDSGDEAFQISGEKAPNNPPTDIYISNNEVYNVGAWAIIHLYYAPQNVVIENNYIHDCSSAWVGISVDGAIITIKNNIIEGCSGSTSSYHFAGINIGNEHGNPVFEIYNNTFINLSRGSANAAFGIYIAPNLGTLNSYVKNNIFYNIHDYAIYNRSNVIPDGEHNLFFNPSGGNAVYDDGVSYSYSNVSNWGTNNIEGNPLFVNPINDNFHLQDKSPAIDTGVNVGILVDFDHNPRPQGGGFDIGAFEFSYTNTQPSPPTRLRGRLLKIAH